MWQFLLGLGIGVYVGTSYDCKPSIAYTQHFFKKIVPANAIPKPRVSLSEND